MEAFLSNRAAFGEPGSKPAHARRWRGVKKLASATPPGSGCGIARILQNRRLKARPICVVGACGILYLGVYGLLRWQDLFVHRAGRYSLSTGLGFDIRTNHFIQPGRVTLNDNAISRDPSSGTEAYRLARERMERTQRRVDQAFILFFPAAVGESLIWLVIDPDPYPRIFGR
jgi:hypothetical protein